MFKSLEHDSSWNSLNQLSFAFNQSGQTYSCIVYFYLGIRQDLFRIVVFTVVFY